MGIDRAERVCVVGAGAAGLSAASYLGKEGFREVVVLEKEDRVGGKCRSLRGKDGVWELGAVLATTDYRETLAFMREAGIEPWRPAEPCRDPDLSFMDRGLIPLDCLYPGWVGKAELFSALTDIARYHLLAPRWPAAFAPGHAGVPEELAEPFSAWIGRWRMGKLAKLLSVPFTAYGYGYYDEVPAAYVLKFFDPGVTRALALHRKFFQWKEGIQTVWERVAEGLDVRTGVSIGAVRRGEKVEVAWTEAGGGGRRESFDRLVLTCPLDDALAFLDADAEEKALVAPIRHTDYRVRLLEIEGLRVPAGFAPSRFDRSGVGRPLIWDERVRGAGLHTFYSLGDGAMGDTEMDALLAEDVRLMGGRILSTVASVDWKYFPHVSPEDYRGGYYRRFEARQGARATYLGGEIASFSTVERTIRYSKELVRRFFA